MKKAFKILAAAALLLSLGATADAQTKNFRNPGYKGSISLTDQFYVLLGVETSHGFMLDNQNYLGLGANLSGSMLLMGDGKDFWDGRPVILGTFVDYHRYMSKNPSSLVLGAKAGYIYLWLNGAHSPGVDPAMYSGKDSGGALFFEPNIGWSWTLRSGNGLTATLGAALYTESQSSGIEFLAMPKLTIGFEF